ncbi:MAG TPA: hypothetical protein VFV31_15945 [Chitinophagaceae bacterium]|nr:hypothetical protein [Chitinophagaceae bacterium]
MKYLLLAAAVLMSVISSGQIVADTADYPETDPTILFFQQGEKLSNPAKTMLVTKAGKVVSVKIFLEAEMSGLANHVLADLDNDGKKELLIYEFTGGAHCCDEIYIFRNIAAGKYQHAAKLFAGNTIITADKKFVFNFYEHFGYFFTCYACAYTDTTDEAPLEINSVTLYYKQGKMLISKGDQELRSTINDNLSKLSEQPYEVLADDISFDNGLRKEVALNLAVFYYAFGKNLVSAKQLFDKYYKFPDAKKVWLAFTKHLQSLRVNNDF